MILREVVVNINDLRQFLERHEGIKINMMVGHDLYHSLDSAITSVLSGSKESTIAITVRR